ncbi:hypothetical protein BDV98DRAFT_581032 [Pterulicium gracile]|uniref:DUF6534 domain-containing protein n=1 Tax=Pterulicium gracile TaxID=1884261 RepID=A0A5C3R011_9AGAR|nr:hypothetical protein BDV98DRAFT_581032 [Pterula gracilis]
MVESADYEPPFVVGTPIADTYGVFLVGIVIAVFLYGITCLQTYFYYISFPRDRASMKYLVVLVLVLDTAHILAVCHTLFHYLITCFGKPERLDETIWSTFSFQASIALNVTTAFIVQSFFTERIYRLSSPKTRIWFSGLVAVSVVAHFAFGIGENLVPYYCQPLVSNKDDACLAAVVRFFKIPRMTQLHSESFVPIMFAVSAILSDILVAGALCVLLDNSRTGIRTTDNLLNQLILYAVNRCVLTTAVAIAEVVCFKYVKHPYWALALDVIIGKLYTNSFLASLNSRQRHADRGMGHFNTVELTTAPSSSVETPPGPNTFKVRFLVVLVYTEPT